MELTETGSARGRRVPLLRFLRSDVLAWPKELGYWGNLIAKRGLKTAISFFGALLLTGTCPATGGLRIQEADKSGDLECKMPNSRFECCCL
jgi:hypothetical protein